MKGKPFPIGNLFKFSHKPPSIEKAEEEYLLELARMGELTASLIKDGERILELLSENNTLIVRTEGNENSGSRIT